MTPVQFPEFNRLFGPPPGLTEQQVVTIPAHVHQVLGGSCDGLIQVVVAWQLSPEEIAQLQNNGGLLYISMLGNLAAHYPSLTFHDATHPA